MKWEEIISVTGKPGLYVIKGQSKSGVLAESLIDKKKVFAPVYHISALNNIAVYTDDDEIYLPEIFKKIFEYEQKGNEIPGKKSSKQILTGFFKEIIPHYDETRFYPSHMKKITGWYHLLKNADVIKELAEQKND